MQSQELIYWINFYYFTWIYICIYMYILKVYLKKPKNKKNKIHKKIFTKKKCVFFILTVYLYIYTLVLVK